MAVFANTTISCFKIRYKFSTKRQLNCSRVDLLTHLMSLLPNKNVFGIFIYSSRNRKHKKTFERIPHQLFETFFCIVLVYHNCSGAGFLSPEAECMSCLTICRAT